MLQSKARWKIKTVDEKKVEDLSRELNLSKMASMFLVQRGYDNAEKANEFLSMDSHSVHDPFLMKDMEKAIVRIKKGIEQGENILVFGDYDADGVTSTSLLYLILKELDANVGYYIPNRFTEGYGPNEGAFRQAKEEDVSLIITVDTGISAVHEIEVAKELGMDVIITDHHEPSPTLPDAYAIINPKQADCPYPNKNLAGVGVAFKLAHALLGQMPTEYTDLVATGTVADLVPVKGENRYLIACGIEQLRRNERVGLKALLEICSIEANEMNEEHIGFGIGPRLNAAGRMDSADPALQLLITDDQIEAEELAYMIEDLNKERKEIVSNIFAEAEAQVASLSEIPPVLIVKQVGWSSGVIGIVASRLVEKHYRPTIVLSLDEETGLAKGSSRSIEGFDMFESLSECREWLPHFGGHPMAAGLTMKIEDIHLLQEKMNDIALTTVKEEDWQKSIPVDLTLTIEDITVDAITQLNKMSPFGVGNPAPKALLQDINIKDFKKVGAKGDHIKFTFQQEDNSLDGIAFQMGDIYDDISPSANISIMGQLSINEWNGYVKPQIMVEDVKVDEWQLFDVRGEQEPWKNMTSARENHLTVISFREESSAILARLPQEWEKIVYADFLEGKPFQIANEPILLLDLPHSLSQLKTLFQIGGIPSRIYVAFDNQQKHFFDTLPTRDHFKWFYGFLLKRRTFDLRKNGAQLAKHKGWTENSISFICKVFYELEFVTINSGSIEIVDNPPKRDLTESKTYKERIERMEIESRLYYSSVSELRQYLNSIMNEEASIK